MVESATPQIPLTDSVIKIDIWSPTNFTLGIANYHSFNDSVSLVCSTNGDFCGAKELVLTYPNDTEINMMTSDAFRYDTAARQLVITPKRIMTTEGNYKLRVRLASYRL